MSTNKKTLLNRFGSFILILNYVAVITTLFALLASFYWLFELGTHFPVYCLIASVPALFVALLWRKWRHVVLAVLVIGFNGWQVAPFFNIDESLQTVGGMPDIRVAHLNVLYLNQRKDEVVEWLASMGNQLEVVQLQEVDAEMASKLSALKKYYPHQFLNPQPGPGGMALLSKLPAKVVKAPLEGAGYYGYVMVASIHLPDGRVLHSYGLHTRPPVIPEMAAERNTALKLAGEMVKEDKHPYKILWGDFNITPYSPYFKDLLKDADLKNSMIGFGFQHSWPSFMPINALRIAIDHLLASERVKVISRKIGPNLGADHYAVLVNLGLN